MEVGFVFCTSYIADQTAWETRYMRWINHHRKVFPKTPLIIIDDGSPYLPKHPDIQINTGVEDFKLGKLATIFHFPNRLGRISITNFPGWFRSFTFSVVIARALAVQKIVHIESDSFILSELALSFVESLENGWTAFWCPLWHFPESAFQVICSDSFDALNDVRLADYETRYAEKLLEIELPFTHVEKGVHGNRYSEYQTTIPDYADFAIQVLPSMTFTSVFEQDLATKSDLQLQDVQISLGTFDLSVLGKIK